MAPDPEDEPPVVQGWWKESLSLPEETTWGEVRGQAGSQVPSGAAQRTEQSSKLQGATEKALKGASCPIPQGPVCYPGETESSRGQGA